ncbi:GntR family transcriptional regulator [Mesorhizobium sp. CAU 1732]|uniref:GntR family transcriptional regulator n=1 Tax=Mesorhizobium sp. CAU 1732 TaxID=3140358 RepID=UPI00326074F0
MPFGTASPHHAALELSVQMRQRIVSLELAPGSILSRKALQDYYGVSSTPVRDMLLKLQEDGLVEMVPQSRTIVSLIDLDQAREAHFLRNSVERAIVVQLAKRPDPLLIAALENIVALQEQHAGSNLTAFATLDQKFHRELFVSAGMMRLHAVIRRESMHIDRIRALHLPVGDKVIQILSDHRRIVDRLKAADPEGAADALTGHLSQSIAIAQDLQDKMPAYFRNRGV